MSNTKAVEQYNFENKHIISCPTEMCEEVSKAYILNQRKRKSKNK